MGKIGNIIFRYIDKLRKVSVGMGPNNAPILLSDVARIHVGPELRPGIAEWNGQGETVGGIIIMRFIKNTLNVIDDVKAKLEELKMVGGLITSTILTLIVIPAIYYLWRGRTFKQKEEANEDGAQVFGQK